MVVTHAYHSCFLLLSELRSVDPQFFKESIQYTLIVHISEGAITTVIVV